MKYVVNNELIPDPPQNNGNNNGNNPNNKGKNVNNNGNNGNNAPKKQGAPKAKNTSYSNNANANTKPNNYNSNNKPKPKNTQPSKPNEKAASADEYVKLYAELVPSSGRYDQGIFKKTKMVGVKLNVNIVNPYEKDIKKVVAHFKVGEHEYTQKLDVFTNSYNFDFPVEGTGGHVQTTVEVVYKLGTFSSKTIKTTVYKDY